METMTYVTEILEKIVNIPSPSGYTKEVLKAVEEEAKSFGYSSTYNRKGGLIIEVPGQTKEVLGLSAHVDTLGAMIRSITPEGRLNIVLVGGFMMESIEGMYCKVHTRTGKTYTGTILTKEPSVHTYDNAKTLERKAKNMEVRLDELVDSPKDIIDLEISTGDYISFDPMFVHTKSGYIKSRHLDDKASVAVLLGVLRDISLSGALPKRTLKLVISNYEEVGFGASFIPEDIEEFIAVDMGALGDDLTGSEHKVSICAQDSSGPYDYEMTSRLISLAKEHNIGHAVDVFPHYGSDVGAAIRGGNDIRGALIGQGVHASHGTERTHIDGMEQTLKLIKAYIER
ncbi:M42 family metallopeptidase [Lacrimispora algidixylanolytica]|uniref:Aminopeptidase n=1 Tax=Lacrimispora algidixylanolytica TaxID=94868 RepID=A0A419T3G1_9FIRM|nr:M42 family metallopeptidase [Lacrimispora algidixylanolytica]RKD32012.1 aminopeptidase [Lacrimispora algidixylanolytica]